MDRAEAAHEATAYVAATWAPANAACLLDAVRPKPPTRYIQTCERGGGQPSQRATWRSSHSRERRSQGKLLEPHGVAVRSRTRSTCTASTGRYVCASNLHGLKNKATEHMMALHHKGQHSPPRPRHLNSLMGYPRCDVP